MKAAMSSTSNDLRNPAQSSPARVGLAASPAQSVQGSTIHSLGSVQVGFRSVCEWLRTASTSPDSFMPSRIAVFISQYVAQKPSAEAINDTASQKITPRQSTSFNCISTRPPAIKKQWPFSTVNEAVRAQVTQAERGTCGRNAAATVPPVGNTGGTHIRSETRG